MYTALSAADILRQERRRLREFNHCHTPSGAGGGQFCSTSGGASGGTAAAKPSGGAAAAGSGATGGKAPATPSGTHTVQYGTDKPRPVPIKVKTVEEALDLLHKGQVVELEDVRTVHVLLQKLGEIGKEAHAKGEKAPNYDLCKVTVRGSNLFCEDRIRNTEYPEGVERLAMPQLKTNPLPGTPADQLPKDKHGNVDATLAFVDYLEAKGVKVESTPVPVPASGLKATQSELGGPQIGGMMRSGKDWGKDPVMVTTDNYILDGHHRWAAVVGQDAEDGTLGQSTMNIIRIHAPMGELLFEAIAWADKFGLERKAAGVGSFKVKEVSAFIRAQARRGLTFTYRW
jgi:hypothetical protein